MEPYIKIDSICVDLSNYNDESTDARKPERFTIRGYVADVRKKDWRKCWPFPLNGSEEQPPSKDDVTTNCRQETADEGTDSSNGFSSGIKEPLMASSNLNMREIDLNIQAFSGDDGLAISSEKENNAEDVHSKIIDSDFSFGNNLNHQVSTVPSPEDLIQELHTNEKGSDGNEVLNTEKVTSNPNCMDMNSSEINKEGTLVGEEDTMNDHTNGHLPPETVACNVPVGDTDRIVKTDVSRKRIRKTRLLAELSDQKGEPKTAQTAVKGSTSHYPPKASAASQTESVLPDNVNGRVTLTKCGRGRKRKVLPDEEGRSEDMSTQRVASELQNQNPEAVTMDTTADNGSKDLVSLQDTLKIHRDIPEIDRSQGRKNKKTQHVDDYLNAKSQQSQERENENMMDAANMQYASKTLSSGIFCSERVMNGFPLRAPRTEKDQILSKGKGKMLQADEDSVAHTGARRMSNVPASIPILSAQAALNAELKEKQRHSLSNYSAELVRKSMHQIENRLPLSLSFRDGTSPLLIRKETETIFSREQSGPSELTRNAISVKGKAIHLQEINGARNKEKFSDDVEFYDLTADEESEQDASDDVPMEVLEMMAKNQYERSLPDAENATSLLEKTFLREKPDNRKFPSGEIVFPNRHSRSYLFPTYQSMFGMNNPSTTKFPTGFQVPQSHNQPSRESYFSQMDTRQRPSTFNRIGSSTATSLGKGAFSLYKPSQLQVGESSQVRTSLPKNTASLGHTSSIMDLLSRPSGSLYNQNSRKDIDLNFPNFNNSNALKLGGNIGSGNLSRSNEAYRYPGKNNATEPPQNLRGSPDMYSNEAIPAMHLLSLMNAGRKSTNSFNGGGDKRKFYPGESSAKTNGFLQGQLSGHSNRSIISDRSQGYLPGYPILGASSSIQIGKKATHPTDLRDQNSTKTAKREKNSSNSAKENFVMKLCSKPNLETGTSRPPHGLEVSEPLRRISENTCEINRIPAELTIPVAGGEYMLSLEGMNFEETIPEKRPELPARRGREPK